MAKYKDAHELYPLPTCEVCHKKQAVIREKQTLKCDTCYKDGIK